MNSLSFWLEDNSGRTDELNETMHVEFAVPEDMNIYTYHRFCKMFALAMGYTEKTVDDCFGETVYLD